MNKNKTRRNFINKHILLVILIIFFSVKIDFFKNFYNIFSKNYDERMEIVYDFCSGEGIGYLRYIRKKFNINDFPKIVNYDHVPNSNWAMISANTINKKSDKIIFLNYPGHEKKIKLYKIKNNLYEFKDVEFYKDKYSKIKKIEIISKNLLQENFTIEIFTVDKSLNKKHVKKINLLKSTDFPINLFFDKMNLSEKKLFFKLDNIDNIDNIDNNFKLSLLLINKYFLNQYKIIDKFKNCYFVK